MPKHGKVATAKDAVTSKPLPSPSQPDVFSDRNLATIDSLSTTSASELTASVSSSHQQDPRQSTQQQPGPAKKGSGRLSASRSSIGNSFTRIVRMLSPSTRANPVAAAAARPTPSMQNRSSGSGNLHRAATAGSLGYTFAEGALRASERSSAGLSVGEGASSQQLQPAISPHQERGFGRVWNSCRPRSRSKELEGREGTASSALDTTSSILQPQHAHSALNTSVTEAQSPAPEPAAATVLHQHQMHHNHNPQPAPVMAQVPQSHFSLADTGRAPGVADDAPMGGGGVGAMEACESLDSSGHDPLDRFARVKKNSTWHLRISLERALQAKGARSGSGPAGIMSGVAGSPSLLIATHDSNRPRESFESDWDVMGADTDSNILSAAGMSMSTAAVMDSGTITGSRGPGGLLAVAAAARASNTSAAGDSGGGPVRQHSRRRQGITFASRASLDHTDALDAAEHAATLGPGGGGRERSHLALRSPTSSSATPAELSFNPNHPNNRLQAPAAAVATALNHNLKPIREPSSAADVARAIGDRGRSTGPAMGTGERGAGLPREGGGAGSAEGRGGGSSPEELLAAQMMALQNRINALSDEDLMNASSACLGFVSPSQVSAPHPSAQLSTLMQFTSLPQAPLANIPLMTTSSEVGFGGLHGSVVVGYQPHPFPPSPHPHPSPPQTQPHSHSPNQHSHPAHAPPAGYSGGNVLLPRHSIAFSPPPMSPLSGASALDALSAFLSSPPSRTPSMFDAAGGLFMHTATVASSSTATAGLQPVITSPPGSAGGGGGGPGPTTVSVRAASPLMNGTMAVPGGGSGGVRSAQSVPEDAFVGPQGAGGSSHRLASSNLGGGGPATSNSSFLSIRPGPGDDPGGMLLSREDTGMLGRPSHVRRQETRSSETELAGQAVAPSDSGKAVGMTAGMLLSTRDSSLGERLAGAVSAGPSRPSDMPPASSPLPSVGSSFGAPLPPIKPPSPRATAGGAQRFTLAAALSRLQEELQQSMTAPATAAGTGKKSSVNGGPPPAGAAAGRTPAVGIAASGGDNRFTRYSVPSEKMYGEGEVASGMRVAGPPGAAGAGPGGAVAAALGRGGTLHKNGISSDRGVAAAGQHTGSTTHIFHDGASSNGVPWNGTLGGTAHLRNPQHHPHHPHRNFSSPVSHPHYPNGSPSSPELVMQQFPNSGAAGHQPGNHTIPGIQHHLGAPHAQQHAHSQPLHHQHHHHHQHHQQMLPGGGQTGHLGLSAMGSSAHGIRPSADPTSSSNHRSSDCLYDEFFGNAPSLPYDLSPIALPGPLGSLAANVQKSNLTSPLNGVDTLDGGGGMGVGGGGSLYIRSGGVGGGQGSQPLPHAVLGPPPIHNRNVRRNTSMESLRIQAAHRSMEGRAAAAASASGTPVNGPYHLQWGGIMPSPLSSGGGGGYTASQPPGASLRGQHGLPHPSAPGGGGSAQQISSERLPQPFEESAALAQSPFEVSGSVAASAGAVAGGGSGGSVASRLTPPGPSQPSSSAPSVTDGNVQGGNNNNAALEAAPPTSGRASPSLTSGLRPFAEGSPTALGRSESEAEALAGAVGLTTGEGRGAGGGGSGALAVGPVSTDAVVAGLMESVLRSGAAAALLEEPSRRASAGSLALPPGGGVAGTTQMEGFDDGALTAAGGMAGTREAAAEGLSIMTSSLGPSRAASHNTAPGGRVPSGGGSQGGPRRDRPGSTGTVSASGGSSAGTGVGASLAQHLSGGAGVVPPVRSSLGTNPSGINRSLEALMAFCNESGLSLLQQPPTAQSLAYTQALQLPPPPPQLTKQQLPHVSQQPLQAWDIASQGLPGVVVKTVGRSQLGVGEVTLLLAGALVILFNLFIIVYVLVTMQYLLDRQGMLVRGGGGQSNGEL